MGVTPEGWNEVCERRGISKSFSALHLPLGHRRFRPTLEDLIRFLIVEKLVDFRSGFNDVLRIGEERYATSQLSAAVRRNPAVARKALEALDVKR